MASFYTSLSNEEDNMLPNAYLLTHKLASNYPSSNERAYESQHSVSLSYPTLLSDNDRVESETLRSRDEMLFVPPTAQAHCSEPIPNYHGLSLSLGSQVPSSLDLNQYTNSSLYSFVSSDMQSADQLSQNKNVQYLSFDLAGKTTQDTVKYGAVYNFHQNLISSQMTNFMPSLHQQSGTFCYSKYLKPAQDLLYEVVNVHKQSEKNLQKNFQIFNNHNGSTRTDVKRDSDLNESTANTSHDLSPSERHDLQNKMTKLLSMLDEVDKRYKKYFHQMQVVVSSFDMVAGPGAAQPYTTLALRTISSQFRCLRDAIKKQIQATQKSLGEQDANSNGQSVLSRLRFVDQQLRQQKALTQFGIMRQPWRPQRGLPETAVSVLRAWLFEHFLHPYPKDSEKIVLARQTGLSRSQVANWFINARVRLWKPMIEDMYKEEFGGAETEPKSSPDHASTTHEFSAFNERDGELTENLICAEENRGMQSYDLRPNNLHISITEVDLRREELVYEHGAFQDGEVNFGLAHLPNKEILNMAVNTSFF